jgi:hypothetical protein
LELCRIPAVHGAPAEAAKEGRVSVRGIGGQQYPFRTHREDIMRIMLTTLLMLAACPAIAQNKEKASTIDVSPRTALAFKVPDAAVQRLLPAGFQVNSPTAGPSKGANINVVLIDYLMMQDMEGKPLPPYATAALNVPSKNPAGETVGLVIGGFIPKAGAPGPYFLFEAANTSVDRHSHTDAEGKSIIDETWDIRGDNGNILRVELQFVRGSPARGTAEAKIHSAAKPDFYRIYKFEQGVDVVRSTATGIDRVSKFSFKASGPKLAPLFDGSQQLISITSVPFYSRTIYLPVI